MHQHLVDDQGNSLLHFMVKGQDLNVVRTLLELGANSDASNRQGVTPLHLAVDLLDHEVVKELLEYGADPNVANQYGTTPFMMAVQRGNDLCACPMVNFGADETKKVHGAPIWDTLKFNAKQLPQTMESLSVRQNGQQLDTAVKKTILTKVFTM